MTQVQLKPIPNFPGFSISQDGTVYSSRKSINGTPKEVKVSSRGRVTLSGPGWQKQRYPKDIVAEVWKLEEELK